MMVVYPRLKMLIKLTTSVLDSIGACLLGGAEIFVFYMRRYVFGNKLPNFSLVRHEKLFRGGQPTFHGLKELKKKGVDLVVNLRARNSDKWKLSKFEDIQLIHLPIYPFRPNDTSVIEFLKIFVKNPKRSVYVHCFHGADRTGLVCAMYRIIFDGWDKAKAISEMRRNGFHFWHRSIIRYIENSDIESLKKKLYATS